MVIYDYKQISNEGENREIQLVGSWVLNDILSEFEGKTHHYI